MRDYDTHAQQLEAAGGRLVVLTHDSEAVLREAIAKKGLSATFVHVEPEAWERLGLQNPRRADLPYPATFIVAPDGTLVFREVHVKHTVRAHVPGVIERVAAWSQSVGLAPEAPAEPEHEPAVLDWDDAVRIHAELSDRLTIRLEVAEGFHVYGANETISRPLAVTVDQLPELEVPIPAGEEKVLSEALGAAWVLAGSVLLEAPLPADAPASLSGTLAYQVCTDATCTAPTSVDWKAGMTEER